uniref:Uncharacterized protein n=1 Tax=Anopheles atroparvus TaxID=41427 RepID=A0A182JLG7_ANOAO
MTLPPPVAVEAGEARIEGECRSRFGSGTGNAGDTTVAAAAAADVTTADDAVGWCSGEELWVSVLAYPPPELPELPPYDPDRVVPAPPCCPMAIFPPSITEVDPGPPDGPPLPPWLYTDSELTTIVSVKLLEVLILAIASFDSCSLPAAPE